MEASISKDQLKVGPHDELDTEFDEAFAALTSGEEVSEGIREKVVGIPAQPVHNDEDVIGATRKYEEMAAYINDKFTPGTLVLLPELNSRGQQKKGVVIYPLNKGENEDIAKITIGIPGASSDEERIKTYAVEEFLQLVSDGERFSEKNSSLDEMQIDVVEEMVEPNSAPDQFHIDVVQEADSSNLGQVIEKKPIPFENLFNPGSKPFEAKTFNQAEDGTPFGQIINTPPQSKGRRGYRNVA